MKTHHKIIGILAASLIGLSATANAETAMNKKEVQSIVKDYLLNNPEIVVESLQAFQQKQSDNTKKSFEKIQKLAPKHADRIFHNTNDPVAGNPNGTITLVEFSDYQCGHCISMTPVIDQLIKQNPNLRVVMKEFPIRGPVSELAAKAAIASKMQNKYKQFHIALMKSSKGQIKEEDIYKVAKSIGLDVNKLKKDMKSKEVTQKIKENYKLAQDLNLMFTPVFFIAKTSIDSNASSEDIIFIPGGVSLEQLNKFINKLGS
ncbi:DsbA family protein [Gammaproteobacteria bacterium]|nr:DsbA family protein [Gammaproteobacteria bacterium]